MAPIPTPEEEDAKRPNREREGLVGERTRIVNRIKSTLARLGIRSFKPTLRQAPDGWQDCSPRRVGRCRQTRWPSWAAAWCGCALSSTRSGRSKRRAGSRLEQHPEQGSYVMVRRLAQVIGVGVETADMLVHEILSRTLRDRKAVARYAGLTGAPDESGARRREKGLARAGNARVRRGMIQLAWRFLMFQKNSALAQWYRARTTDHRGTTRKTMIVALARKLLSRFGGW